MKSSNFALWLLVSAWLFDSSVKKALHERESYKELLKMYNGIGNLALSIRFSVV